MALSCVAMASITSTAYRDLVHSILFRDATVRNESRNVCLSTILVPFGDKQTVFEVYRDPGRHHEEYWNMK